MNVSISTKDIHQVGLQHYKPNVVEDSVLMTKSRVYDKLDCKVDARLLSEQLVSIISKESINIRSSLISNPKISEIFSNKNLSIEEFSNTFLILIIQFIINNFVEEQGTTCPNIINAFKNYQEKAIQEWWKSLEIDDVHVICSKLKQIIKETVLDSKKINYSCIVEAFCMIDRKLDKNLRGVMKFFAEEMRRLNKQLEELAITDKLTGLFNRAYLDKILANEVIRCLRYWKPLSVIFFDVDHFKRFNDIYWHEVWDIVLKWIWKCVLELREIDSWCRYGWEEFCIILPWTDIEWAKNLAEKLRKKIEELEFKWDYKITISLWVAGYKQWDNSEKLLKKADSALYEAKDLWRNRVVVKED